MSNGTLSVRNTRWLVAGAIVVLILGVILSRVIEPGVRVEKVTLTNGTPALKFIPAGAGPHPVALLALAKAHAELDRAVDRCYRKEPFPSDRARVEYLFQLYEQLTAPLLPSASKSRAKRLQ